MITVQNLAKRYGARALFEDVNLRFDPGKRYGIVGANGAGKSTFLRILTGEETSDGGEVSIPSKLRMGTLNQDHFAFENVKIMDVVMKGKPALASALEEKEQLFDDPEAPPERFAELEEIIYDNDGYVAEARIAEMLEGLGVSADKHYLPMSTLSGGFKLRVLLAQCLFSDPDLLLLDEPTNHLDILSIRWLEEYLRQFKGVVIVVSHDREFLNRICTNIADIDFGGIKIYTGNYDQFLTAREMEDEFRTIENEKAEKKIGELKQFVDRFKAKASKARQAGSKAKQIERMEAKIDEPVYSSRVFPRIEFGMKRPPGKRVLEVEGICKSYGDHQVLKDVSVEIYRGDKVAIIGPNGVGKSTLLKILMDELKPDDGIVQWGHETHPQYFSQDHHEAITRGTSVYEWLYQWAPTESIGTIRGILGNLLFSGDDVHKSTGALSGGEAARLVLAKLVLLKGNVLLMDEPTNHLDMESIESLVEAIQEYEGTLLLVSHNRYVVDKVATKVLEIKPGSIDLFDGTYQEYLSKMNVDHLDTQVDLRAKKKDKPEKPEKADKKAQEESRKATESDRRKAYTAEAKHFLDEVKRLEGEIESLESKVSEIDELFGDPNYFTKAAGDEIKQRTQEKKDLETRLGDKMARWEQVNNTLEGLRKKYDLN